MSTEDPAEAGPTVVASYPFGPEFFLEHLRAFARDHCPDPAEGLPRVLVHLVSGEQLELCHVIGLAPGFVALAVRESAADSHVMRTELVPYACLARLTIRPSADETKQVGFNTEHAPRLIRPVASPERVLSLAAGPPRPPNS